ncbi:MAG: LysM peptidoglycan-binding domain-containing protein [Verrucomicrobiota bacterium]|nr:LysM peptidoglycan-binding domain-containing protein [Verrucomicrobiota bacterium]
MKLGKIFIIVLALHVVVIGGILGYHFLKSKNKGVSADMATQNVIESAPSSINNKVVADMDSASTAIPTTDAYATEIITEPASVAQSTPPSQTTPVAKAPVTATHPVAVVVPETAPAVATAQPVPSVAPEVVESVTPTASVPEVIAESQHVDVATSVVTYKVQKGDTLIKIAKKNNVSVSSLKTANKLSGDNLKIGQALTIPGKMTEVITEQVAVVASNPATGTVIEKSAEIKETIVTENVSHTVKKGDTLYRISKLQNVSVDAIKSANKLTGENLKVGQKLVIPGKTKTVTKAPALQTAKVSAQTTSTGNMNVYVVQKGDSIYGIAKKHNVPVQELVSANNIKDVTKISVGQKLSIPAKESTTAAPKVVAPAVIPAGATAVPSTPVNGVAAMATAKVDEAVKTVVPVQNTESASSPAATVPASQMQMANSEKLD